MTNINLNKISSSLSLGTDDDVSSSSLPKSPLSLVETYISKYGTNYWEIIHLEAFKITIDEMTQGLDLDTRRKEFLHMFEYLIKNMKCSCRNHAYHIFMINPHTRYKYIFQYTIDFHNQVNLRLGKRVYTYEEVLARYKSIVQYVH